MAPSWGPSWDHVGHFFGQKGGAALDALVFFVRSTFGFDFFARAPGVPHREAPRTQWGTPPGFGYWVIFLLIFGCSLGHLGARADLGWVGGITRSAKNFVP